MPRSWRIAVTADLHWGHHQTGMDATRLLAAHLRQQPPDLLILGGDIGTAEHFAACLALFEGAAPLKALVPGNHDLWVLSTSPTDSLQLYREGLPAVCASHGFHYLDGGPLVLPEADLAVVGSVNWYDYSWSLDRLRAAYPDELHRLESKRFTHGRHNDANYVRWPLDDVRFTESVVETFERHLTAALDRVSRILVVTHHPPFYGLSFSREGPPTTLDGMLWDAFTGNRALKELLTRHADRIAFAFCGHTHRARENTLGPIRGYNVGGDYHFKRLLVLDWPAGTVEAHEFGQAR